MVYDVSEELNNIVKDIDENLFNNQDISKN